MKKYRLLPLVLALSATAMVRAEESVAQVAAEQAPQQEVILPQLSFEAQKARASEIAQQAEHLLKQEEARRVAQEKQAQAEQKIKEAVGNSSLLFTSATAKVYAENDFAPMWSDAAAEKTFLKEYALFAASGVSKKSTAALQRLLNTPKGLARDILLTDSFLDYLYYQQNVTKNANTWLYQLGSYVPKVPAEAQIHRWTNSVKAGSSAKFIANLVPNNHIYHATAEKLLSMSSGGNAQAAGDSKKNKKSAVSFAKLALNAQRLRIIPDFNHGIFVNIPSYQLFYMRNGELALQSKVIVGREDRRTPVMTSKLSNVVVNPPWTIPPTILSKDIVPKLAKNPGYAERAGYEIFDRKGNRVNASSVNWSSYVNAKNIPYIIRQKAGDNAALGRYKFNMPSSDAIYLHDTNNHGLFGKSSRALSSGCVRVAKSDELATILLKEAGWTADRKSKVLASKKTTSSNIRSDNPVYLYYVTAWVENGKVHTLPDIYKYDNLPTVNLDWEKAKSQL